MNYVEDRFEGGSAPTSPTPVKLGTQPALVYFHPDDELIVGEIVRYKEYPWKPWGRWYAVYVHGLEPLPFLEKM